MASPHRQPAPAEAASGAPRDQRRGFPAFNVAAGAWFAAWGVQMVLFTWLLVDVLGVGAERVGFAQMALVLPAPFFLVGGVAADRYDRRDLLVGLHGLAGLVAMGLATVVALGWISYPVVLGYALVMGTLQAFVFPARDALLSQVAGSNMLRAVAAVTIVQFGLQSLGSWGGGYLEKLGMPVALVVQGVILWLGIPALLRLPHAPPARQAGRLQAGELLEGVREVMGSPVLRMPMFLTAAIGLFFMGPYFVAFPVMLRDFWQGSSDELGLLQATFPFAALVGTSVVFLRGSIEHKGRALLLAQTGGALCLLWVASGVSFHLAIAISLLWGLCGSVFLNASRTLFQESASESHRARVLSVYNLGFMGAGVIGLPLAGVLTRALGPHGAFFVSSAAMLSFLAVVALFTNVRNIR